MAVEKEKIALFDFCETLVPFQSAPRYIEYVLQNYGTKLSKLRFRIYKWSLKYRIPKRLERITSGHIQQKEIELWPLKGFSYDVLNNAAREFYECAIRNHLIPEVYQIMNQRKFEGYRIVLVSGGFSIYLKYFAADNHIPYKDVFATELSFQRGIFNGRIIGKDCMGVDKVQILEKYFDKSKIDSIAYSDSNSDLPLLQWADKGVVIVHDDAWKWYEKFNFEVIQW